MSESLLLLQNVAPDFGATFDLTDEGAGVRVSSIAPGGGRTEYRLNISSVDELVKITESDPRTIPKHCPDRHLYADGSFCLGWRDENPSLVVDVESAKRWWLTVIRYLNDQTHASNFGNWPGQSLARAHGPKAASAQSRAEAAAAQLGPQVETELREGRLVAHSDRRPFRPRIELYRDDKRIARIFECGGGLVSSELRCPCLAPGAASLSIGKCGSHAGSVEELTMAVYDWRCAEREFWNSHRQNGFKCCGTLADCGFNSSTATRGRDGRA